MSRSWVKAGLPLFVIVAMGCASTPTPPPSADTLKKQIASEGAEETLRKQQVEVTGNAFFGHEVVVGGDEKAKAPARYYFNGAPFPVDHLNGWAALPGSIALSGSALSAALLSVLMTLNVIGPVPALIGVAGCSIPLLGVGAILAVIGEWGMSEAGEDYNSKLKAYIKEQSPEPAAQPSSMQY